MTIRRRGKPIRRWRLRGLSSARPYRVLWYGRRPSGQIAGEGGYMAWVRAGGARPFRAGAFRLAGHFFPVRGPHAPRSSLGSFGDPRSGGRRHEGFDVVARCGTPLAAVRAGRIVGRGYDPVLYGHHLTIKGRGEGPTTYFYSHLSRPPLVGRGQVVRTGQRVGFVGRTGNARSTPCHLHIEIRRRGRPVDPEPLLRRWDGWS